MAWWVELDGASRLAALGHRCTVLALFRGLILPAVDDDKAPQRNQLVGGFEPTRQDVFTASTNWAVSRLILEIVTASMRHSPRSANACSMANASTSSQPTAMSLLKITGTGLVAAVGVSAWATAAAHPIRTDLATWVSENRLDCTACIPA